MITPQEKIQCVSWFIETKSDIQTQRNYTTKYAKQAPTRQSIRNWHKQFMETGTLLHKLRSGRPRTSEEDIEHIHQSFSRSPRKTIRTASVELQVVPLCWSLFCIFSCVISLCLNIRFCFNKPRNTLYFFLWSNHFYKAWKSIILFFEFCSEIKK